MVFKYGRFYVIIEIEYALNIIILRFYQIVKQVQQRNGSKEKFNL